MATTSATGAPPTMAAYLDRIGVAPGPPDLALLTRIVRAHVAAIPFENLDPFTGVEPPVDGDGVAAKLVHGRRGGWCFEHNRLLHDVLRDLGYQVTPLVGRVRIGLGDDAPATSRTHRLTLVATGEGTFVADAGFGGTVPTTPLRLVGGTVQPTPHADHRYLRGDDGGWRLQRRGSGDWVTQYDFDLVPTPDVDYAMGSWYLVHHPDSGFRNGLTAARSADDHRATLDGTHHTVRYVGGPTERRELTSPAEVVDVLEDRFGIDTSGVPRLEDRIREVHFS
ncbi:MULTISPECIES: arylamine N-acetyltransferase family protein [unclassified Pseudonocardia]|uniref:arylamine N-acetyltransferase family protein n=1 Tax=unclassified Pseudonocardia TaxID=2619320 RepID=UPI0009EC6F3E|nr:MULTISPECIES: arylamine N-acetyltransferase [unclassified Pseudonocardia]